MTDIVERLREGTRGTDITKTDVVLDATMRDAADEIERLRGAEHDAAAWIDERTKRLRSENERLRAALREIAEHADLYGPPDQGDAIALIHVARRALENQ